MKNVGKEGISRFLKSAPFHFLWLSRGGESAAILMISTPTLPTSHSPSSSLITRQIFHALNTHTIRSPQPSHDSNSSSLITMFYPGILKLKQIFREGFHIFSLDSTSHSFLKNSPTDNFHRPQNFHQIHTNTCLCPHLFNILKGSLPCNCTC